MAGSFVLAASSPEPPARSRHWNAGPASPREGGGPAPLEETQALFIYLSVYPAARLFIFKSTIISLGRHQEGKKVKLIRGPFQVGSQLPAASRERRPSDLLPARERVPGGSAEGFLRSRSTPGRHLRPPPHQGGCARLQRRKDALHWETCVFCKVINLAAGSVSGAAQASGWVSVQEYHMAWGAEAPVRTLDFIIMTCVTLGTCPSLQTMWQTQEEKGFQGQILGCWAERAHHMLPGPGLWVGRQDVHVGDLCHSGSWWQEEPAESGSRWPLSAVEPGPGATVQHLSCSACLFVVGLPAGWVAS